MAFLRAGYNVQLRADRRAASVRVSRRSASRATARSFFLILLKVITIFSPLRIFVPISAASPCSSGVVYGVGDRAPAVAHPERRGAPAHVRGHGLPRRPRVRADLDAALPEPSPRRAMSALVLIPTYNERENLPLIVAGVLAHPDHTDSRDRRWLAGRDRRSSPTNWRDDASRARLGDASHGRTRPRPLVPRRLSRGDSERRRLRVSDGRRPLARSQVPAVARRRGAVGRRAGDRIALRRGRQGRELAAAAEDAERVRQLVHPHGRPGCACATAPAATAAGGGKRWPRFRSTAIALRRLLVSRRGHLSGGTPPA